jgi:hypothetical protein
MSNLSFNNCNIKTVNGLVNFFISLEEISYGQKIFNWQTPSLFKEYNLQQETNLHNLKELSSYIHPIFMVVGFYGGFAWVYKHISRGGYLPI